LWLVSDFVLSQLAFEHMELLPFSIKCWDAMPAGQAARFNELDEHSVGRPGVDERHLAAVRARARLVVDQFDASRLKLGQQTGQVFNLEADVVYARPAILQELLNRPLLPERLEQLETALTNGQESRHYSIRRHVLNALDVQSKSFREEPQGLWNAFDRESDVVDLEYTWQTSSDSFWQAPACLI
jgi:hypothetical protein